MIPETTAPSRRTIAKGAAWAVPAVTVAAAAPSLAASPSVCTGADLQLTVENCRLVGLLSPEASFRITNPAGSGCTVPTGTPVTLTGGALADVGVAGLDSINVGILDFDSVNSATLQRDLAPGQSVPVRAFPAGLNVNVLGTYTLSIMGASASFNLTAGVGPLLSVCTSSDD